ncbi:MAG: DUF3826 domain-containing protein [Phycisphaerae bacterium]|nr:DUF3826 domain-containing protein [Phycisphaerae bacterium]
MNPLCFRILLVASSVVCSVRASDVPPERMQAIYEEVRTPYKYGIVIPAPEGKKVDCPTVFRHGNRWYMVYVQLENEPQGYTTQLAASDDLLHWQVQGTILARGDRDAWDKANAAGGIALVNTQWGSDVTLDTHEGRYWMSYLGGARPGYETPPLSIGMASTLDPVSVAEWEKLPAPVLRPDDADARPFETGTLFKSFVFRDEAATLGAPFVMYYNARPPRGDETIGIAISQDLRTWRRYGHDPVVVNPRPPDLKHGVISGDPQIVRMGDLWVMFYFGAFWKPKAFDTFAASTDLVHWTHWDGPHLIEPSEPWDEEFAHKPWVLKHDGVVYHFYCAVGDQGRAIALATSRPMETAGPQTPPPASDPDPDYTRVITGRADKIVKTLDIPDDDRRTRVRDIIVQQYRDLNAIHTQRDKEIEAVGKTASDKASAEALAKSIREQADGRVRQLHQSYLARLSAELTPEQVDQVKDGMTYGILAATYQGYLVQVPELTDAQKQQIMAYLVEARELAMDAGTSEEKHQWFRKYKGRINNYLSAQGYRLK